MVKLVRGRRLSPWLDGALSEVDSRRRARREGFSQSWHTGTVESVDESGQVELRLSGAPESAGTVVARGQAGLWVEGAHVRVLLDASGRVVAVEPPVSVPDGAGLVPVGEGAKEIIRHGESLSRLDVELTQTREEVAESHQEVVNRLNVQSQEIANVASVATRKSAVYRATTPPTPGTYGRGDLWWQHGDEALAGPVQRQWVYDTDDGWTETEFSGEVIAAGTVKARQVDAVDIAGGIGRFLEITTDQLKAGSAKIAGTLLADTLEGKTLRGGLVEMQAPNGLEALIRLALNDNYRPEILFKDFTGIQTILDISGIEVTSAYKHFGSVLWQNLVSPPALALKWSYERLSAMGNVASGQYGYVTCLEQDVVGDIADTRASWRIADGYAFARRAGWYFINVRTRWLWSSNPGNWAVASAIKRSSNATVNYSDDPGQTLYLVPGVGTDPSAVGFIYLEALEGVKPAWWQNSSGPWRPSSASMNLIYVGA